MVGTSPSVTYNNGVAQGTTTSTWVSTNSLVPGTTYYLRVFAVSSCNGVSSNYGTSAWFTTSGGSICITPGTPINVIGTATGQNSASLDWSAGIPAGTATVRYFWVVGTSPTVLFGNGVIQGITTDTWFPVNELTPGTTYYLRVYAVSNCNNIKTDYGTSSAFTTLSSCSSPTVQSSDISFSFVSTQQFTVNWNNGNGSRRIVKINTSNSFSPPANGTDPIASSVYGGSGEQVVYNGVGNSVTITSLPLNSTIWVRIYEANCSGINANYNILQATKNPLSQNTVTVVTTSSIASQEGIFSKKDQIGINGQFENIELENSLSVIGNGNLSPVLDNYLNDKIGVKTANNPNELKQAKTSVFPNPASDFINFYVEAKKGAKIKIDVYNCLGQKIGKNMPEEILTENKINRQLDSSGFEKGIYHILIHIDDKTYNHKLLITN